MTKGLLTGTLGLIVLGVALFANVGRSEATFHLMRVEAAMGGANGNSQVQYVELRMANGGQSLVGGHVICFFDASGAPYARFTFPSNVSNGVDGSSILIGTVPFDMAWAVSSPDFTFSPANTTAIASGADVDHPIRAPGGKISFGSDTSSTPATMCQAGFAGGNIIDTVAYGTGYTGTVDFGSKLNSDLPTNSTNGIHLVGPLCIEFSAHPCAVPRDNSVDYSIVDENVGANQPRKNQGDLQGPINTDTDGDGVQDASDLCPGTAAAAPVDVNGCSQAQVDPDADGICSAGAPSGGPGNCTSSDNCPAWANPTQALPAWAVPSGDGDCDGWPDTVTAGGRAAETAMGTSNTQHCAATAGQNNEPTPDAWPVDFNDDQLAGGLDVLKYSPVFNKHSTDPGYDVRFDLTGDNLIGGLDVLRFSPVFNKHCT